MTAAMPDMDLVHLSELEIKEYRAAFVRDVVTTCKETLQQKIEESRTFSLNIAIIGNCGAGKSSFINAIRGLTADDNGAAAVGVNETTTVPTPYMHPSNSLLTFWDLPGVGTLDFPKETYLEKIGYEKFDFFVIISKDRFTENDLWIALEIAGEQKPFFFVRSNIHNDITNDRRVHPKSHNPMAVLISIRDDIKEKLGEMYREDVTFLIDNHKPRLYDFESLEQRIVEILPAPKWKVKLKLKLKF